MNVSIFGITRAEDIINIRLILFFSIVTIVICGIVIIKNGLEDYKRLNSLNDNTMTIILLSIITPIIDKHIEYSVLKYKTTHSISNIELEVLINDVYTTVQKMETVKEKHKKLLTKEVIRDLISPYYKQIVYQTVMIEKYYAEKYKKQD